MQCPKCGFEQPQSDECRACGIIIEKFRHRPANPPAAVESGTFSGDDSGNSETAGLSIKTIGIFLAAVLLIGYAGLNAWNNRPVVHPPGIIAPDAPEQRKTEMAGFQFEDFRIIPLADFAVNARVLSKKKYYFGRESDLAPIDLALGWGPMSDESVLGTMKIRQSNRFFFWSAEHLPIPRKEIELHGANMHLIPSDNSILRQIKKVRTGQVVDFSGYLVRVEASDGWRWISSLNRNDTGNGACEVACVNHFVIQ